VRFISCPAPNLSAKNQPQLQPNPLGIWWWNVRKWASTAVIVRRSCSRCPFKSLERFPCRCPLLLRGEPVLCEPVLVDSLRKLHQCRSLSVRHSWSNESSVAHVRTRAECNQQRNRLCAIAPLGFGFRACSPYRRGRDCGTPKPGKKKQKRDDYACAVLIIHRFPFPLLLTRVVRKIRREVTPKAELSEQRGYEPCLPFAHVRVHAET